MEKVCIGCIDPVAAPSIGERLKHAGIEGPAGVQHNFPAPLIPAKLSKIFRHAFDGAIRRGNQNDSRIQDLVGQPAQGCPAPIARTAARAVEMDRPVTPPTRQPSSCKRRPRARPTRPAPTMDTVSDIRCVSILYAAVDPAADNLTLHTFWIVLFSLIASLWIVQGIRAGIGMARLPWLSDVPPIASEDAPPVSDYFCRAR